MKLSIEKLKEIKENLILLTENDNDIYVFCDSIDYILEQIDEQLEYDYLINLTEGE
jgi:hypothetical protein